jgi:hypothetical protein
LEIVEVFVAVAAMVNLAVDKIEDAEEDPVVADHLKVITLY